MNSLVGTGVALVTPFNDDLSVDHKALANIVKYNVENGTNYLVISGTTGESVTITKEEKTAIPGLKMNKLENLYLGSLGFS